MEDTQEVQTTEEHVTQVLTDGNQSDVLSGMINIMPSYNTALACTSCGITVPIMYLKRRRGLYALLCFRNGEGCWERSSKGLCSHVDPVGAQCQYLAEYEITSIDGENSRHSCVFHIRDMIKPGIPGFQIFPLED